MSKRVAVLGAVAALGVAQGLKVGFLGDSDHVQGAERNYQICREEGCDVLFHTGDYDYDSSPSTWEDFQEENVGDMLFLGTSGNHEDDVLSTVLSGGKKWEADWFNVNRGYKRRFYNRLVQHNEVSDLKAICNGRQGKSLQNEYGNYMSCRVGDIQFVTIGWAQFSDSVLGAGGDRDEARAFIEKSFSETDAKWKVFVVHRPEGKYNPGESHTGNYETEGDMNLAAKYGAITIHGHSHVYGRTKLINNFYTASVSPSEDPDTVRLGCGETISVVNGMGGKETQGNGKYASRSYFNSKYTTSTGSARNGILICDFGEAQASCEFKVNTGAVHDAFSLLPPPASSTCRNTKVQLVAPETASDDTNISNSTPVEAIVGGSVGAVALVAVLALVAVRRKRTPAPKEEIVDQEVGTLQRMESL